MYNALYKQIYTDLVLTYINSVSYIEKFFEKI